MYLRTNGNPVEASWACLKSILQNIDGVDLTVEALGVTGSGRHIAGLYALTDGIINEIIAHAAAAARFDPEVDTIFEIGAQDAKYTSLTHGVASDYAMNEACSAGTGSFLEESVMESLTVGMEDVAESALHGQTPPNFAQEQARSCGVIRSSGRGTAPAPPSCTQARCTLPRWSMVCQDTEIEMAVEQRVSTLEALVAQVAEQQIKTEKTTDRLSEEMIGFKDDIREDTRVFEHRMATSRDELNAMWGNLANKMGTLVEDIISPNVRGVAEKYFGVDTLDPLTVGCPRRIGDEPGHRTRVRRCRLRGQPLLHRGSQGHRRPRLRRAVRGPASAASRVFP